MSSTTTHTAAVLHGARDLRIEHIRTPTLQPDEVSIAPRATGLCGTDMHYYENGKNGMFVVDQPLVLGHEAAGEILEVGSSVTSFKPGDRVVFEPQRPCGSCQECRHGTYNLCPKLKFTGSASANPPVQGSLQSVYQHPANFVFHLPDSISYQEAALIEPLSVSLHAVRRAGLHAGQSVLVVGAGPIGLLCAIIARISGASTIGMVDVQHSRLEFAIRHGYADYIVDVPTSPKEGETKTDFATRIAKDNLGRHPLFKPANVAFECTGVDVCANLSIHSMAPRGKVVIVGMGAPHQVLNVGLAAVREVDIINVWRYANTFQTAIDLLVSGNLNLGPLISHTFSLAEAKAAFDMLCSRPADLVKCIITSQ
ncbi:chaperonin 10-like protein [Aspergillus pseudotamarii]|uniref:D-xylulose reductase n=1 Tax=Aspergillus pseudotamarii TaxID=132259 RepID=A0A5N6TCC1_ASPPS|nr:chaperonin 10-like protein [Aspergillus pseudotamarii]KAE8143809.1 chaperonin 10-like protein [Aspergillus pseudotamarii]